MESSSSHRKIGLTGNPNTGKSSIFNALTGMRQHVGNFAGVTVERKHGWLKFSDEDSIELLDLPGSYSIIPQSEDERIVYQVLSDSTHTDYPNELLYVLDLSNCERNLFLLSQLYDQNWPITVALTMCDRLADAVSKPLIEALVERFEDIRFVVVNARTGQGLQELTDLLRTPSRVAIRKSVGTIKLKDLVNNNVLQRRDATYRYAQIRQIIGLPKMASTNDDTTASIDKWIVHPIWGYSLLLVLLFLMFQVVYHVASVPMDWIDGGFGLASEWLKQQLPSGVFTALLADGIVPGIGGVVVFVPQIALLFLFLSLLEESGYMARIVFLTDRVVRPFGLSGRSIVPLISSSACAIPGVMATRTIPNLKDKLITIFVAPLMSCSARIPVYTLLIALVIPDQMWGPFHIQGVVLFLLYALGLITAFAMAFALKFFIRSNDPNYLLMELPRYQWPRWSQIAWSIWSKIKVFVWDAGRVIMAISILLWVLAAYGPGERMAEAAARVTQENAHLDEETLEKMRANAQLENSYIGILGKTIEPAIEPLGYDWKIGIALITSFAAREVFVGSMATIYSVGEAEDDQRGLIEKMRAEKRDDHSPRYSLGTGLSLMVFYAYAMQCMATLAVVRRETNSWKWPLIQLLAMAVLAFIGAWITYTIWK